MSELVQVVQEVVSGIPSQIQVFKSEQDAFDFYYSCAKENGFESDEEYTIHSNLDLIEEINDFFDQEYSLYWFETEIK